LFFVFYRIIPFGASPFPLIKKGKEALFRLFTPILQLLNLDTIFILLPDRVRMHTVAEAKAGTAKMYKQTLARAVSVAITGKFSQSLKLLGRAIHIKQDIAEHQYGVWRGKWEELKRGRLIPHIKEDLVLRPGEKTVNIKVTQKVIDEFMKRVSSQGGDLMPMMFEKYKPPKPPKLPSPRAP
jgi:hypothetical protein